MGNSEEVDDELVLRKKQIGGQDGENNNLENHENEKPVNGEETRRKSM